MILLDTNVVSEAMKSERDARVQAWLNDQAAETLFLSSVSLAELLYGVATLPDGRRKRLLQDTVDGLVRLFHGRLLPFDEGAAKHYAVLATLARSRGLGFPTPDGYIAAIAASRGFAVASRDTSPYIAAGVQVINPWQG